MLDYFFSLDLLCRTDLLEVGAFLHVNYFHLSRMHITFFIVTLCACTTCYNNPCACANNSAISWRLLFFSFHCLYSFGLPADVLILILISSVAACDKCSLGYFQVIAEFYNNDTKSLSFPRFHCVLASEVIHPHCNSKCTYCEDQRIWRYRKSRSSVIPSRDGVKVRAVGLFIIYFFFFYSVLFLVFPVHLDLESRFI